MAAGVVVNTNISSIHAARVLSKNRDGLETAMARLSSGKRLNSAADDAAATSVAAKMRADVRSTDVAVRNINDGISLFQTFDGAASEIENILIRTRELAVQMKNGTYDTADVAAAQVEFGALLQEIDRIAIKTEFNRIPLTNTSGNISIHLGAASGDAETFARVDLRTSALGDTGDFLSAGGVYKAVNTANVVTTIDKAIADVASARATAGSHLNRLGFALSNAQNMSQRLKEALSGLEDADYAAESAALARGMVLAQAGTAMLAQANQAPQYVLSLLRS